MKYKIFIDDTAKLTARSYEGSVNQELLIKSLELFWSSPRYNIGQDHVVDLRLADLHVRRNDIMEVVEHIRTASSIHDRKVALLIAKPKEAALTAFFKEMTQIKHITEFFLSEQKALKFINAPEDFLDKLNSDEAEVYEL